MSLYSEDKLISHLFDTQTDSVVWFTPKFDSAVNKVPVDFEVGYCNTAACQILGVPKQRVIGSLLKSSILVDEVSIHAIWEQCLNVWNTGESINYTYYSPVLDKHFNVQRSKVQNGVLSITRDHTQVVKSQMEKQLQANLLTQIIESSESGISVYEAIRDNDGKIRDFRLKLANEKCGELTSFSLEDLYKYTVKELMVIRGHSGYFEMVSNLVETGIPKYTEYFLPSKNIWLAFSIKKFNDGYILNYIDITRTKTLEKKAQEQADMLNAILDASITGLITLQAIYDASGKVEDFKFIHVNQSAQKLLGIKLDEEHKTYLTLFPDSRKSGFFELYLNVLLTGNSVTKEFFYKGEGYNGWYYISVSKMNENTLVQSFADITNAREVTNSK